jgi:hypothetical protein
MEQNRRKAKRSQARRLEATRRYFFLSVQGSPASRGQKKKKPKTINIRDSLVVTHPTTSLTAHCFSTAERTGSPVFSVLWSIAEDFYVTGLYKPHDLFMQTDIFQNKATSVSHESRACHNENTPGWQGGQGSL